MRAMLEWLEVSQNALAEILCAFEALGRPVEAYLLAAVLYFVMCLALSKLVRRSS